MWNAWETKLRLYLAVDHRTYSDLHDIAVEHEKPEGDMDGFRQELISQFHNALQTGL